MTKKMKITNRKKIIYVFLSIILCLIIIGLFTSNRKGIYFRPAAKEIEKHEEREIVKRGYYFLLTGNGHCELLWDREIGYSPTDSENKESEASCNATYKKYANVFSINDGQYIGVGFWKYVIFIDKKKASGERVSLWKWSGKRMTTDPKERLNYINKER